MNQKRGGVHRKVKKGLGSGVWALWLITGMALILALVAGAVWWVDQPLLDLSYLHVSRVEVRGNAHVATEEVLSHVGLQAPVNILQLRLRDLASKITTHPWIRNASIRRQLPLGLVITIEERKPIGMLVTGRTYLLSADAVILDEVTEPPVPALPTFRATWRAQYRAGEHIEDPRLLGAVHLLESLGEAPRLGQREVEEIAVEADGNYILHLTGARAVLRLSPAEPLSQLTRLDVALRHRGGTLESLAYVDLRFSGRVILKPREKGG